MNKKGIAVADNAVVDLLYPVRGLPAPGELTTITGEAVTSTGGRAKKVALPALKYTDYCIINETETEAITGIALCTEDGSLITENMPAALDVLKKLGVSTWAVIHCPESAMVWTRPAITSSCRASICPRATSRLRRRGRRVLLRSAVRRVEGRQPQGYPRDGHDCRLCLLSQPGSTEGIVFSFT